MTPSSQIVGSQAVFNVLMGKYKVMTGEFADLMLGYYGATIGAKNPEVLAMALEHAKKPAITGRPADLLKPEWEQLRTDALALDGMQRQRRGRPHLCDVPAGRAQIFQEPRRGSEERRQRPREESRSRAGRAEAASERKRSGHRQSPVNYVITLNGKEHRVTVAAFDVVQELRCRIRSPIRRHKTIDEMVAELRDKRCRD